MIATPFAFRGGASQDGPGKDGLALFGNGPDDDEGAGDLDSTAFQEREQALAMRMDFDAGRDVMLLQASDVDREQGPDAPRFAAARHGAARFDADALARARAQIFWPDLKFDENDPETVASIAWDKLAFSRSIPTAVW